SELKVVIPSPTLTKEARSHRRPLPVEVKDVICRKWRGPQGSSQAAERAAGKPSGQREGSRDRRLCRRLLWLATRRGPDRKGAGGALRRHAVAVALSAAV